MYSPSTNPPTKMSINLDLSDSILMNLNAIVNGSQPNSLSAVQAWTSRTDENATGLCGLPCANTCNVCVQAEADLAAFYAPQSVVTQPVVTQPVFTQPVVTQVMTPAGDEEWDEEVRAARTRDEAEEAARSGMLADDGADYDAADRADPAHDEDDEYDEYDAYGCQCLDCLNYDSRQDDYDDGDCGLDWNESGYFD